MALVEGVPVSETASLPAWTRPAVLVVDDDRVVRQMCLAALGREGFRVVEAGDGAETLALVSEQAFSIVLLDEQLPVLSGRQVLVRLRARRETSTLPVILMSSSDVLADRLAGLAAGADEYLPKPFSVDEMLARVRAHLRAFDAWQETIAAHDRQRTVLARALEIAGRQSSLDGGAGVLCNALAGQTGAKAAAILRFTADQLAVPLATSGPSFWGLTPGDAAPSSLGRYLHDRACIGPWIEPPHPAGELPATIVASTRVACAPFGDDSQVHGVLLLDLPDQRLTSAGAALAAAIDFAAVTYGLLHRGLLEQHDEEANRIELRSVLQAGSFAPHFQPILDFRSGEVVGLEALTRFTDGTSPETRFREAAIHGMGIDLELATLEAALAAVPHLPSAGAWIGLNVSPALMLTDTEALADVLEGAEREIVLELSEQEAVTDYDAMRRVLADLGGGLRLSIDDAGSGFASLRHILRLEPAFVKLDRSWVREVDTDPARQAMIAGLRHFADQTGALLVAEGIEREAERDVLIDLRVDLGQGYLLGRPAPV